MTYSHGTHVLPVIIPQPATWEQMAALSAALCEGRMPYAPERHTPSDEPLERRPHA